jgi:hypothetical protein
VALPTSFGEVLGFAVKAESVRCIARIIREVAQSRSGLIHHYLDGPCKVLVRVEG